MSSSATDEEDRAASERHDDANRMATEIANEHAVALFWAMAFRWITPAEAEAAADALLGLGLKLADTRYPAERYEVLRELRAWTLPQAALGAPQPPAPPRGAREAHRKSRLSEGSTVFAYGVVRADEWSVGEVSIAGVRSCTVEFTTSGTATRWVETNRLIPTYDPAHDGGLAYSDDPFEVGDRVVGEVVRKGVMSGVVVHVYPSAVQVLWADGDGSIEPRMMLGRPGLRTEKPATTAPAAKVEP